MRDNCCYFEYSSLKKALLVFNVIFWCSGPAILGLSIWFLLTLELFSPAVDVTSYKLPTYVMLTAGSASIIFGICGCLGSINENRSLVMSFLLALVVIFAAEIFVCVETFKRYDEVSVVIPRQLNVSMTYLYKQRDDATLAIDRIQNHLSCCGVLGYSDWRFSLYYNNKERREVVPESCCYDTDNARCNVVTITPFSPDKLFPQGCLEPLEKWVKNKLLIFGWGSFGFCTLQLFGIVLACFLYKAISVIYDY